MKMDYNKNDRKITLAPNFKIFKKYINRQVLEKQKDIPKRKDNNYYLNNIIIDCNRIEQCQTK